jgi:hypothetical protein
MTHAQMYQHGMKAYIDGNPLSGNPYNSPVCPEAGKAWSDGWLEASRAWWRIHAVATAGQSHIKKSPDATNLISQRA